MATYNPPTEDITVFNTSLFNPPEVILTQSEADLLYLSKKNVDTSTASNTTFTGTINSTIINTANSNSVSIGTAITTQLRAVNIGVGNNIGNDNVLIGYGVVSGGSQSVSIGRSVNASYSFYTTAIGSNTSVIYNNSTVLGYSATATAANQVVLGTASETVIIPNRISFTPSSYSFPFSSNLNLGYYLKTTGTGTAVSTATPTSILTTASIPIGVWRIDFSIQNTVSVAGTITVAHSFVSATNNGAVSTAVAFTGSVVRSHVSEAYAIGDIQILTSSFTYNQSTAGVLYLNILRTFATGTYSFVGELSITRLA
jgi:hypothetical protein